VSVAVFYFIFFFQVFFLEKLALPLMVSWSAYSGDATLPEAVKLNIAFWASA
jgi:hypothetical protein